MWLSDKDRLGDENFYTSHNNFYCELQDVFFVYKADQCAAALCGFSKPNSIDVTRAIVAILQALKMTKCI